MATATRSPQQPLRFSATPEIAQPGVNEWLDISERDYVLQNWGPSPVFRDIDNVWTKLNEMDPEEVLRYTKNGAPVTRPATCARHGLFQLAGTRFGQWIAWVDQEARYSSGWHGAGEGSCPGCHAERKRRNEQDLVAVALCGPKYGFFVPRRLYLETPAHCTLHGRFIFRVNVVELDHADARVERGARRVELTLDDDLCARCEAEAAYEYEIQEAIGLSNEEWERGSEHILRAIDIARGNEVL